MRQEKREKLWVVSSLNLPSPFSGKKYRVKQFPQSSTPASLNTALGPLHVDLLQIVDTEKLISFKTKNEHRIYITSCYKKKQLIKEPKQKNVAKN